MLVCLNCGKPLNKKFVKKYCCWDCKLEYEAQDKHLAPLSRLSYTAMPKKVYASKLENARKIRKISLEKELNKIEHDDAFWGRAKQRFTVIYNNELSPQTKRKLKQLIADCKKKRKALKELNLN